MTYRLEVRKQDHTVEFEIHGLLDPPALATVRAALELARDVGVEVRIILPAGTEVERSCVAELRALRAEVVAHAPYLAAWLAAPRPIEPGPRARPPPRRPAGPAPSERKKR